MKTFNLKVHVMEGALTGGLEYLPASYPHDGVFLVSVAGGVQSLFGRYNNCVMYMGTPAASIITELMAGSCDTKSAMQDTHAGISEDTLLKALAIVQQPQLAVQLVK